MSGLSLSEGQLVARSLKVTRSTYLQVAAVAAGVAANASVAMQLTGILGQVALSVFIFASLSVGTWAISTEIFTRASQTVSNLRSIGATGRSLSSAVLLPVLVYGVVGSGVGVGLGLALGVSLGGHGGFGMLVEALFVVFSCAAATAVGVYAGGRAAWRS